MNAPAGIKEVAARAGVSVGTVSNVLNRPHLVRPQTRSRVEAAMSDLGFVRNESARQLRAGHSRILGYVFLDAGNPFYTDVARGAEDACREEGLALVMCTSDGDASREDDYLALLLEHRVHGVLITALDERSPRLRSLPELGVPVVLVDRPASDGGDWCSVGVDDVHGGDLAVSHLLTRGHRRVAFAGATHMPQVADRLSGARRAVRNRGLPPEELVLLECEALTVDAGGRAARSLLDVPAARRPTAVFCGNDLIALGLLQELLHHGVRVPEDVAIVGYDDIDFAAAASVPLSSVRQPRHLIGRTAADLLLREAEGLPGHVHEQVEFTPELVIRRSSDPVRADTRHDGRPEHHDGRPDHHDGRDDDHRADHRDGHRGDHRDGSRSDHRDGRRAARREQPRPLPAQPAQIRESIMDSASHS